MSDRDNNETFPLFGSDDSERMKRKRRTYADIESSWKLFIEQQVDQIDLELDRNYDRN
jgi:hypothetical protein